MGAAQAPPFAVKDSLYRISHGLPIPAGQLTQALLDLRMVEARSARDGLLASLMTGLMARGPVEEEVVEILRGGLSLDGRDPLVLRPVRRSGFAVLAGSGKKGLATLNVSTPSAIIAAAAGAVVVKIGSHATSSVMGSRDLARCLKLPESPTADEALAAVGRCGFAFVPIEDVVPALDDLYGGRFHVVNPFSFGLAALASPLHGEVVVYGLAHPKVDLAARVLQRLGISNALVVASGGRDGYFADELGVGDRSLICEMRDGQVSGVRSFNSATLPGFSRHGGARPRAPVSGEEALRWAQDVITDRGSELHLQLVAINAALVLIACQLARDLEEGYDQARTAMADGRAAEKLQEVRESVRCCELTEPGVARR